MRVASGIKAYVHNSKKNPFRYFGWYADTGHTELITRQMANELRHWHSVTRKPMVMTEYGADTVAGMHQDPPFIFTEEFQVELMAKYHAAFDEVRREGILHGEMIWNFADFMTKQQVNRVVGNRKGIFTRQRQPKMSAHMLRARYWKLAEEQWNSTLALERPSSAMCFHNN